MSRALALPVFFFFLLPQEPPRDFYGDPLPPGAVARFGTIRFRHFEDVCAVAFQPDGKVLTAVDYGFVHWWDASTGVPIRPPVKREGRSFSGTFSGDAKLFAVGEHRKPDGWIISIYDSATGKPLRIIPSGGEFHGQPICVALSTDGSWLAFGGNDGQAAAWDIVSGERIATFKGHEGHVRSIAVRPDGRFVATAGNDKTLRLWNAKTGDQTGRIDTQRIIYNLALSRDGTKIAGGSIDDRSVRVWDIGTLKELCRIEHRGEVIFRPQFSPDDSELMVVTGAAISFHEPATGRETRRIAGGGYGSALSLDGLRIATVAGSQVRLWDAKTGAVLHGGTPLMGQGMEPWFSPDDSTFRIFGSTVHTWECATGRLISSSTISKYYLWYGFSPDRRHYARHLSSTGKVTIHEASDDREIASVELKKDTILQGLTISNGAKKLAVRDENPAGIHLFDVSAGAKFQTLPVEGRGNRLAFSPNGELLAAEGESGSINIWNTTNGACKTSLRADQYNAGTVQFSSDGEVLIAAGQGRIGLWNAATGDAIYSVPLESIQGEPIVGVTPDGRYVAGPVANCEVKIWESATGQEVMHIVPDRGYVNGVAFSNGGSRLAVIAGDGNVLLWNLLAEGRKKATLEELWEDLASGDAKRAHVAVSTIALRGSAAAAYLRDRLIRPPATPDAIRTLIGDLTHEEIEKRDKAALELGQLDAAAEYQKILEEGNQPAAVVAALRGVLNNRKPIRSDDAGRLRRLRAITALAWGESAEGTALLKRISETVTDLRIREEAVRSLDRPAGKK